MMTTTAPLLVVFVALLVCSFSKAATNDNDDDAYIADNSILADIQLSIPTELRAAYSGVLHAIAGIRRNNRLSCELAEDLLRERNPQLLRMLDADPVDIAYACQQYVTDLWVLINENFQRHVEWARGAVDEALTEWHRVLPAAVAAHSLTRYANAQVHRAGTEFGNQVYDGLEKLTAQAHADVQALLQMAGGDDCNGENTWLWLLQRVQALNWALADAYFRQNGVLVDVSEERVRQMMLTTLALVPVLDTEY